MSEIDIDQEARKMLSQQASLERFFDRFSAGARRVLVSAQEEAALLGHHYIGTEHLLLGLLREDTGIVADVLKEFDVSLEQVRAIVERVVGRGDAAPDVEHPFTPRAQIVITMAVGDAWHAPAIDAEYILLGLLREGERQQLNPLLRAKGRVYLTGPFARRRGFSCWRSRDPGRTS